MMKKTIYIVPVCDVCLVVGRKNLLTTINFNSVEKTSGGTLNSNDMFWEEDEELFGTTLNVWDE